MSYLYSVIVRERSKKLEQIINQKEIPIYDSLDLVYQSFSKEKALAYYNTINKTDDSAWKGISKEVITTLLDKSADNKFVEEMVASKYW